MIGTVVALNENLTDIKVSRECFKVKLSMESNLQKSHYRLTPLLDWLSSLAKKKSYASI